MFLVWVFSSLLFLPLVVEANGKCESRASYSNLCPNPMFVNGGELDGKINLTLSSNSICNFYKDLEAEATVVVGIHVQEEPWMYHSQVSECPYYIKLGKDRDTYFYYERQESRVCGNSVGTKLTDDAIFWHNFTLTLNEFKFVDLITNYENSPIELNCASNPQYIIVTFASSRRNKCVLLVQQYRVDHNNSGCDNLLRPFGLKFQFCGAYPCTETISLLQDMKLASVRGREASQPEYIPHPMPKTTTTTPKPTPTKVEVLFEEKPFEWLEWVYRLSFPTFGILCTICFLKMFKISKGSCIQLSPKPITCSPFGPTFNQSNGTVMII